MNSPGNSGIDQPAPNDKWPHMRRVAPDGQLVSRTGTLSAYGKLVGQVRWVVAALAYIQAVLLVQLKSRPKGYVAQPFTE